MGRLRDRAWARDFLNVREGTLASWIFRRQIPHVRLSPRTVKFDEDELRAWVEARRVPAPDPRPDELSPAREEIQRRIAARAAP